MFSRLIARLALALAFVVIGLIAGVVAVAFLAYAVYLALLSVLVPPAAAAITGVVVIAGAGLLLAIVRAIVRPRRRPRGRDGSFPSLEECETAAEVGSDLGRKLRGIAGANSGGGLLAALVAGFAVGVSPKLRAFLQAILKP